eukprot:12457212-Ditylum_brightwellii.AAC.1
MEKQGKSITLFMQQIHAQDNIPTKLKDSAQKTDLCIDKMETTTKALSENQAYIQANMHSIAGKIEQSEQSI